MTTKSQEFDKLLLSAIDEALNSLGEAVKKSIYFHIENKFSVTRSEISENLLAFQERLEKIFGTGASLIEILIMKNLYSKLGFPLKIKSEQFEFVKYVDAAKEGFLKQAHEIRAVESKNI